MGRKHRESEGRGVGVSEEEGYGVAEGALIMDCEEERELTRSAASEVGTRAECEAARAGQGYPYYAAGGRRGRQW